MTYDDAMPRPRAVIDTEGAGRARPVWWKWWPLVAIAGAVPAWFWFGVDVLYGTVVAGGRGLRLRGGTGARSVRSSGVP